ASLFRTHRPPTSPLFPYTTLFRSLLRINDVEDIGIARQLLRAHEYWRMKQLPVDLVILNERAASYVQDLQVALEAQHRMSQSRRSEEHTSELQSLRHLVCRLLLEK